MRFAEQGRAGRPSGWSQEEGDRRDAGGAPVADAVAPAVPLRLGMHERVDNLLAKNITKSSTLIPHQTSHHLLAKPDTHTYTRHHSAFMSMS